MRITLRSSLLEQRIEHCGGRIVVAKKAGIDRTTLWRWLKGGKLPDHPEPLIRLAVALELDVLLLFEFDPDQFSSLCQRFAAVLRSGDWEKFLPAVSYVEPLFLPATVWPPPKVANWYDRPWHTVSFTHTADGQCNYYAPFLIEAQSTRLPAPQVWHFAYRNLRGTPRMWLPYGYILLLGQRVELYNYASGICDLRDRSASSSQFITETWFGSGPAEFCVASLHPYKLTMHPTEPSHLPCVRFA